MASPADRAIVRGDAPPNPLGRAAAAPAEVAPGVPGGERQGQLVDGVSPPTNARRPRGGAHTKKSAKPPGSPPPRLVDTPGPDPATPLAKTRLAVGRVVGVHGVRGELKVVGLTDEPEHLARVKRLWLGDETRPRTVLGVRFHAGNILLRLNGISSPEEGRTHRGQFLRMAGADAKPLPAGEFRLYQLVGLDAMREDGVRLGRVTDVMETGANDVFVISPDEGGADMLLPYHPTVILEIRPDDGRMIVRPMRFWDDEPVSAPPADDDGETAPD